MLELLDDTFRLDHLYGIWMTQGTEGHYMHASYLSSLGRFLPVLTARVVCRHAIENAAASYRVEASGAIRCGMCVCSFQLTDQLAGDGGFACIPGSHSASPLAPSPRPICPVDFCPAQSGTFAPPMA